MNTSISVRALLCLTLSLLLSACGGNSRQPDWLDKPSTNYPADKFLSSVGEADTREAASSRARANLSQIFQVAIKDSSEDFSQAIISGSGSLKKIETQQRAARFVSTEARQVLEGTEIIEYWQSPEGKIYSLAVLEKTAASRRFRDSVRGADRKTADLIEYASEKAPNPVAALRALESARINQVKRDNANRNLSVTSGKGISGRYSGEKIESLIRQALSTLQFSINADDTIIQPELENAAASLGIQQSQTSSYKLSSKLDTEPLKKIQGWWWLRGSLELELSNNGETIAKQRWPIKESSTEKGVAKQRVRDAVNKKLGSNLYQMLTTTPSQ